METPVLECLFNKAAGLQVFNFVKKRLQHGCFSVIIAKVLRISILKNIYFEEHLQTAASVYSNEVLKCKNCVIKTCFQGDLEFIKENVIYKKNFICKEKSGAVEKAKLVTKIMKLNQLYYGTSVFASCCYSGENA